MHCNVEFKSVKRAAPGDIQKVAWIMEQWRAVAARVQAEFRCMSHQTPPSNRFVTALPIGHEFSKPQCHWSR